MSGLNVYRIMTLTTVLSIFAGSGLILGKSGWNVESLPN
jgi:hypothetical protein